MVQIVTVQEGGKIEITAPELRPGSKVKVTIEVQAPPVTSERRREAEARLQRFIGAVSLGHPTGTNNQQIDADLAREYEDAHEDRP